MEQLWNNNKIQNKWFFLKRYYAVNWSFYEMQPHIHNELEIMYIVFGECMITCYDKKGTPHTRKMKSEEYVLIDSTVPHTLYIPRDSSCRILNLEISIKEGKNSFQFGKFSNVSHTTAAFLNGKEQFRFLQDKNNELLSIITGLQSHANTKEDISNNLALNLYFAQFLVAIAEQSLSMEYGLKGNRYVFGARRFMEDNLENNINVSDIATELGISDAYLQRIYKQSCGKTLIETLNQLRMEKACVLLAESNLPVIDIAVSVGFNSRQHFSHTFTKHIGCSPAKYRGMKGYAELYEGFQDTASHKIVHPDTQ